MSSGYQLPRVDRLFQSVLVLLVSNQTVCLVPPRSRPHHYLLLSSKTRLHSNLKNAGCPNYTWFKGGGKNLKPIITSRRSAQHKSTRLLTSCQRRGNTSSRCDSRGGRQIVGRVECGYVNPCGSEQGWGFLFFFCLMCERGGLSFLQMSEWTRQLCVMSDLEYATLFSYFQCQIRKYIEFKK